MTIRRTRQLLWIAVAALIAATIGGVSWSLSTPPSRLTVNRSIDTSVDATDTSAAALPSLKELKHLANRPLRRPLYDPPPPPQPEPVAKAPTKLPVRLIGVAIEPVPQRSTGLFAVGNSIEFKRPGDLLETPAGEVTVEAVSAASASVTFRGRSFTLELVEGTKR